MRGGRLSRKFVQFAVDLIVIPPVFIYVGVLVLMLLAFHASLEFRPGFVPLLLLLLLLLAKD